MLESILGILSGLVALLLMWWRRRNAQNNDPYAQHRQKYRAIDREMAQPAHGQAGALRNGLADDLDELDRLQKP